MTRDIPFGSFELPPCRAFIGRVRECVDVAERRASQSASLGPQANKVADVLKRRGLEEHIKREMKEADFPDEWTRAVLELLKGSPEAAHPHLLLGVVGFLTSQQRPRAVALAEEISQMIVATWRGGTQGTLDKRKGGGAGDKASEEDTLSYLRKKRNFSDFEIPLIADTKPEKKFHRREHVSVPEAAHAFCLVNRRVPLRNCPGVCGMFCIRLLC